MEKFEKLQGPIVLVGRILLSAIFISSGISKIFNWDGTAAYMTQAGMPAVTFFLLGAIALEVLGGFSVLLGLCPRLGAAALIVFLIPATLIFHNFWAIEDQMMRQMQMIMFMKNMAIMGGLLMVLGFGTGRFTIMDKFAPKKQ
ncbi:MAG: DoxX family protein [Deltaproteobacteria bacterium]|nr:MAG: DoxX family protein [Deltaproteobacteria bacterium]